MMLIFPLYLKQLFFTGQRPNTAYLQTHGDALDAKTGMAHVTRYLQLSKKDNQENLNHIFVVGDAANAGHNASSQAGLAVRNIARLVALEEGSRGEKKNSLSWIDSPLESYEAPPHKIKVSVGFNHYINENNGNHTILTNGHEDLNAPNMWRKRGLDISDMTV